MKKVRDILCLIILCLVVLAGCTNNTSSLETVKFGSQQSTSQARDAEPTASSPSSSNKSGDAQHSEAQDSGESKIKQSEQQNELKNAAASDSSTSSEPVYDKTLTGKNVCLTFDDGPASNNTPKVLAALKKYNVKATFFICGPDTPEMRKMIKQAFDDGHTIGIHCYSHKLKSLYKSEESFFADFNKLESIITEVTGSKPNVYRFPGGTNNGYIKKAMSDTLIKKLKERGYEYYDWNASGMDDNRPPAQQIANNVIRQCKVREKAKTPTIVLLHDSFGRYTTGDAVPIILEELTAKGYTFIPLSHAVKPVHLVKK